MIESSLVNIKTPPVTFVTGKGGVGKTIVAATIAKSLASAGKRVVLLQSSIEDQVGPLFGQKIERHRLSKVEKNLYAMNLDIDLNFRDFFASKLGFSGVVDKLFDQPIVRSFLGVIPGIKELALLGRVYHMKELENDPSFDAVVFDGFSSGHFLHLMTTPQAVFDSGVVGTALSETKKVDQMFRDEKLCGLVHVTTPDVLAVNETLEFIDKFHGLSPVKNYGVVVNRIPIDFFNNQVPEAELSKELTSICISRKRMAGQAISELQNFLPKYRHSGSESVWLMPDMGTIEAGDLPVASRALSAWEKGNE